MGLFINNDKHPDVFKNDAKIKEPNQEIYKHDYLSEIIAKQKEGNEALRDSFRELEKTVKKQNRIQSGRLTRIVYNIREINDRHFEQKDLNNDVTGLLENIGKKNDELTVKMEQQIEVQQQLTTQISKQEDFQDDVIKRLENQEALTEKMLRKIDYFRSILYERTHVLADKIEEGYNSTSSYIHELVTGTNIPSVRYKLKREEKSHD